MLKKSGIADVFTEFTERLKTILFPILSQLKQDDIFYLSSDHKFIEKTDYHYMLLSFGIWNIFGIARRLAGMRPLAHLTIGIWILIQLGFQNNFPHCRSTFN